MVIDGRQRIRRMFQAKLAGFGRRGRLLATQSDERASFFEAPGLLAI